MSLSLPRKYGMRKKRHCFGDVKGFVRIKTMLFCTNRNVSHHTEKSQSDGHFPYWTVGAVHSFVIVSLLYKTTTLRSKQNDKTSQDEVVCWSYGTCPELCDFSVWRTASRDRSFVILFYPQKSKSETLSQSQGSEGSGKATLPFANSLEAAKADPTLNCNALSPCEPHNVGPALMRAKQDNNLSNLLRSPNIKHTH